MALKAGEHQETENQHKQVTTASQTIHSTRHDSQINKQAHVPQEFLPVPTKIISSYQQHDYINYYQYRQLLNGKNLNLKETCEFLKGIMQTDRQATFNAMLWNVQSLSQNKFNLMKNYLDEWSYAFTQKSSGINFDCSSYKRIHFIDIIIFVET